MCTVWIKAEQDTKLDIDACEEAFDLYENHRDAFYKRQQALSQSVTDWDSPEMDQLAAFYLAEQQASYPILVESYLLWGLALLLVASLSAGLWWYGGRKVVQNR